MPRATYDLPAILKVFEQAAEAGEGPPTNNRLCELFGWASWSMASRAVAKLEEAGLVTVERGHHARNVTIVATGKTAVGLGIPLGPKRCRVTRTSAVRREIEKAGARRTVSALSADRPLSAAARLDLARRLTTLHPLPIARPCPVDTRPVAPADKRPPAFGRDPCPYCATRGDLGCAHFAPCEGAPA